MLKIYNKICINSISYSDNWLIVDYFNKKVPLKLYTLIFNSYCTISTKHQMLKMYCL
jgi:hypothetical protein